MSDKPIDKNQYLNKKDDIINLKIKESFIIEKIEKFKLENGTSEEIIRKLFEKADNNDLDNIFCRTACIDLIYSTQIQRFDGNGIVTVTEHIKKHASEIAMIMIKKEIDYDLYRTLVNVTFSRKNIETGEMVDKTRRLYSFVSKFLSFTMPDIYPIMDSRVKKILGLQDNSQYEVFSSIIMDIQKKYKDIGIYKSLKEWDMFLWQWEKDLEEEFKKRTNEKVFDNEKIFERTKVLHHRTIW